MPIPVEQNREQAPPFPAMPKPMTSQEAINILNGKIKEMQAQVDSIANYINNDLTKQVQATATQEVTRLMEDHTDSPSHLPNGVMISRYK